MRKLILILLLIAAGIFLFAGRSAIPHPVYIELHDSEGNLPMADNLEVNCWLKHKPEEVLDMQNSNLIYPIIDIFLQIQCAGFGSWGAGDTLHVEILDKKINESLTLDLELNFDNYQLFNNNHLKKVEKE